MLQLPRRLSYTHRNRLFCQFSSPILHSRTVCILALGYRPLASSRPIVPEKLVVTVAPALATQRTICSSRTPTCLHCPICHVRRLARDVCLLHENAFWKVLLIFKVKA
ncbi:unnamed protein product [Protopolystoma xenopodis]|uniref:Uncharacterized protein n=1 Tax=Protopolystoma xenopodis TaxID=117903 RepID=A0A3S5CK45_9PLAT|nr:unnamed protein product [Protopolystoma xenopodis]